MLVLPVGAVPVLGSSAYFNLPMQVWLPVNVILLSSPCVNINSHSKLAVLSEAEHYMSEFFTDIVLPNAN